MILLQKDLKKVSFIPLYLITRLKFIIEFHIRIPRLYFYIFLFLYSTDHFNNIATLQRSNNITVTL